MFDRPISLVPSHSSSEYSVSDYKSEQVYTNDTVFTESLILEKVELFDTDEEIGDVRAEGSWMEDDVTQEVTNELADGEPEENNDR